MSNAAKDTKAGAAAEAAITKREADSATRRPAVEPKPSASGPGERPRASRGSLKRHGDDLANAVRQAATEEPVVEKDEP